MGRENVSPAAHEFYVAAAVLVATIQDVFRDPHRLHPCPIGDDEHEPPPDRHATWWGFVYAGTKDSPIHPTNRRLLHLITGLWKLREALRAPALLLKGKETAGAGRKVYDELVRKLYSTPWLIEPDDREPSDRRFWLQPLGTGLADQLRVAARDLEFPPLVEGKAAGGAGQFPEVGAVDHLKREMFKRVKAELREKGHRSLNAPAAAVVNKHFGTDHSPGSLRVMSEHPKKRTGRKRTSG